MYLDGVIGMPLYNFTVENEERFGYQYPIAESFNKIYQITGAVPEYILDFLAFFVISENKGVSQYKRFFTCNKAELDIEWQTGGYMAGFTLKLTSIWRIQTSVYSIRQRREALTILISIMILIRP